MAKETKNDFDVVWVENPTAETHAAMGSLAIIVREAANSVWVVMGERNRSVIGYEKVGTDVLTQDENTGLFVTTSTVRRLVLTVEMVV